MHCVSTASAAKTLHLPCIFTAFVATIIRHCLCLAFPLPSQLRQRLFRAVLRAAAAIIPGLQRDRDRRRPGAAPCPRRRHRRLVRRYSPPPTIRGDRGHHVWIVYIFCMDHHHSREEVVGGGVIGGGPSQYLQRECSSHTHTLNRSNIHTHRTTTHTPIHNAHYPSPHYAPCAPTSSES